MAARVESKSRFSVLFFVLFMFASVLAAYAHSQTYTILHKFNGSPDGDEPHGVLSRDTAGNLYGTTDSGGTQKGAGTIFRLDPTGGELILHYFDTPYGTLPMGGLTVDAQHNGYGTTFRGGNTGCPEYTCGVVYKITSSRKFTVLHYFTGGADGSNPLGNVVRDPAGNLYGTTSEGGTGGAIFKIDPAGNFSVLHQFAGDDGVSPAGSMIRLPDGNLYGTTQGGGTTGGGTIFRFNPTSGEYKVLYSLDTSTEGSWPLGRLVADPQGNLYGTTQYGGIGQGGTIFKLSPSDTLTVLHSFYPDSPEGYAPQAGLIRDSRGNFYGTAGYGGALCYPNSCGSVFKMDSAGNLTILHEFDWDDGADPAAELIQDSEGNLYGTTWLSTPPYGVVFKIAPQ